MTVAQGTPRTDAHLAHLNLPDGRKIGIPDQTLTLLRELERENAALSAQVVMADRLGLKRAWFQPRSSPHYDVSQSKRLLAIQYGAIEVDRRQLVAVIKRLRGETIDKETGEITQR